MAERQPSTSSAAWVAVGLTVLLVLGDIGNKYWGTEADGRITAKDVAVLTDQGKALTRSIDSLNEKIGSMPTAREMAALAGRVDKTEGQISDLYNISTGLRHDLDNRLPPPVTFRNPPVGQRP